MANPAEAEAGDARTGVRLAMALLGYFLLVTLVITLSPFDFTPSRLHVSFEMAPNDMIANIALFLPIGFLARSLETGPPRDRWRAVSMGAGLSLLIEIAQIFIPARYVSPVDIATNTFGAFLGIVLRDRLGRSAMWRPQLVGQVGLDIPLVDLLYLLVPQLWLSGAGLADDPRRSVTTLLLGCAGSIVLVALHRHRWQGGVRLAARVVPPLALVWFAVGALPALSVAPGTFITITLVVIGFTLWLLRASEESDGRRFEVETLRRFLPVFVLYLIVAALWPPFRGVAPWHGAIGFANRLNDAGVVELLELLEQVGGFTLFGYAVAEWRGRQELGLAADLPGVVVLAGVFATSLEAVQGILSGPGASVTRALLSTSGAVYGTAVYHLARAHVRALRASHPVPATVDLPKAA